jgi:His-Xaa-Ser system radical SAM maturase HxsB
LLPFRFERLHGDSYIATNFAGEYVTLDRESLRALVDGDLRPERPIYRTLQSRHFLLESGSDVALDLLATKYRTKKANLADFTGLHMFVVTLRCDHSCPYCQVSRVSSDRSAYDMSGSTADRSVDLLFRSPNPRLKVEFQGGEPLLNFELVRRIVLRVKERNETEKRDVQFVVATNLAQLSDAMLEFFREHGVGISTSLDGPRDLHNANRPRPGGNSYELAVEGIRRCRAALGPDAVSALMTTTARSLEQPEAIIDEYVRQGFSSVFLRWLSPYGFASKTGGVLGYPAEEWNRFYEQGLSYILSLNQAGLPFAEQYAAIVLNKILTPYPTGYVDLQSPSGLGISAVVYNYDGEVYASDESRMVAETGDKSFRLGNVHQDSYEDIFLSERLLDILASTMTECTPMCSDCAFEPFCGTDPLFHHATQGDIVGYRPTSAFCRRNMFVFKLLVSLLEDGAETRHLLTRWAYL